MSAIRRAILSCYDKTGLVEFCRTLREYDVELIATSGTLRALEEAGVEAQSIEAYTGVREMLDGRVKSLHPKVHAGLLGIRDKKLHLEQMQGQDYDWIDLIVANQRPLAPLMEQPEITLDEVLDQADIGGTAMIRSAAKNFRYVTVIVKPDWYPKIVHEMRAHEGEVTFKTRYHLAKEAFIATAAYDQALAKYLQDSEPEKH